MFKHKSIDSTAFFLLFSFLSFIHKVLIKIIMKILTILFNNRIKV
jgi:hypothetical protein